MYDWNDLKFFLAVARNGSTIAAARALNTSQSTVQRRLVELERSLGQRLVTRHPRGYRLTALGEALLPLAENAESAAFAVERHVAASAAEPAGIIRLTCPEALVNRFATSGLLDAFHRRHPAMAVELVMGDRFMDLASGEADIAIRAGELAGDDLVARKLATSPWAVYASKSYVERHGQPATPAELDSHVVVEFDGPIAGHRAAKWLRRIAPNARSVARNNSIPGLLQAVSAGLGAAPLPVALGAEHGLVQLFDPVPELTTTWYLLVHRDLRQTPRISTFCDFIAENRSLVRRVLIGQPLPDSVSPQAA
jgi:DNA-binding transcriptional LysR family regulator